MKSGRSRPDHKIICDIIESSSRVLDLGCGSGELLLLLAKEKQAKVQGVEVDDESVYRCVEKGLSVFHSDIDSGLSDYPSKSFDYVILNQTLQEARKVEFVLREALRIGRRVIVGFPNFAHIRVRMMLFFGGKTPVTPSLPNYWYDTPNLHFLSISDFREYCDRKDIRVLLARYPGKHGEVHFWPNLLAFNAIFMISE